MKKVPAITIGFISALTILGLMYIIPSTAKADTFSIPPMDFPMLPGNLTLPSFTNNFNIPSYNFNSITNSSNMNINISSTDNNGNGYTKLSINAGGFNPKEKALIMISPNKNYSIRANNTGNIFFNKSFPANTYIQDIQIRGLSSNKHLYWNNLDNSIPSNLGINSSL